MVQGGQGANSGAYMERAPSRIDQDPADRVLRALAEGFPKSVSDGAKVRDGFIRARVDRGDLYEACTMLRDRQGFEHTSMISAVEYDNRFEVVYHLYSYQARLLLELITTTPKDDPSVDSVALVWGGANWHEREAFDLMGIVFKNHPKLERILLPKDTMYHPLRKDFKG